MRNFLRAFRTGRAGLWLFLAVWLGACSTHKEKEELEILPVFQSDDWKMNPGEKLRYSARAGGLVAGYLDLEVRPAMEDTLGRTCAHIVAGASTRRGISWISKISHRWDSWIDTGTGRTVLMRRVVRENSYVSDQEIRFYPDSLKIVQKNLNRKGWPDKVVQAQPGQMTDLVNVIWKLRYTGFEKQAAGDTLRYLSFFDGEWLFLQVRYAGIRNLKWKGRKVPCFVLVPLGIRSPWLRGEDPSEIWIETAPSRRPLEISVSTYLASLRIRLE